MGYGCALDTSGLVVISVRGEQGHDSVSET